MITIKNQFNNATLENNTDPEKVVKLNNIEELPSLKIFNKNKSLCLFHINAGSLVKNFDDPQHVLNCTNKKTY